MLRRALLIALVTATACKQAPPRGDLPPATAPPTTPPAATGDDPHAGMAMGDNPHAGMPAGDNPHAGMATPHAATPQPTTPKTLEALPDGRLVLGPFSLAAPKAWTAVPTTSSMRAAQFTLPGKPGTDAELIVYYFGAQGAGSVDDNLDRWMNQFEQADGKKSRDVAKIEHPKYAGQDATFVSVAGHFQAEAMPGGAAAVDKQDQALLAAIVASPSGPYYFKLVGAKPTVDGQAAAFRALLGSLKLR